VTKRRKLSAGKKHTAPRVPTAPRRPRSEGSRHYRSEHFYDKHYHESFLEQAERLRALGLDDPDNDENDD